MRDSVTYQAILDEGRVEGQRRLLLQIGRKRFGRPKAVVMATLSAITDVAQLEALGLKLITATSWENLLGLPPAGRRQK